MDSHNFEGLDVADDSSEGLATVIGVPPVSTGASCV